MAGVAAYLAYLVRPDNALYALFVPPLCLDAQPAARGQPTALLAFAATLSALIALDLLLKTAYLGTPLPLGVWVKRPHYYGGFAGEYTWNPLWFLSVFVLGLWVFIGALIVFTTRRSARPVLALLSLVAVTFAAFFDVNQIMGHLGRFYFPSLPFVVVAAALSVDRFFLPPLEVTAPALVARARRSGDLPARRRLGARRRGRALPGARRLAVAGVAGRLPRRRQASAARPRTRGRRRRRSAASHTTNRRARASRCPSTAWSARWRPTR